MNFEFCGFVNWTSCSLEGSSCFCCALLSQPLLPVNPHGCFCKERGSSDYTVRSRLSDSRIVRSTWPLPLPLFLDTLETETQSWGEGPRFSSSQSLNCLLLYFQVVNERKRLKAKGTKDKQTDVVVSIVSLWSSRNRLQVQSRSMKILADAKKASSQDVSLCGRTKKLPTARGKRKHFKGLAMMRVLWKGVRKRKCPELIRFMSFCKTVFSQPWTFKC